MEQFSLRFAIGDKTEPFLQDMLKEFGDEELDQIHVKREIEQTKGLVSEPITIAAILLTSSPILIYSITRLIERVLENNRQKHGYKVVIEVLKVSEEAAKKLMDLQGKYANISIAYPLSKDSK